MIQLRYHQTITFNQNKVIILNFNLNVYLSNVDSSSSNNNNAIGSGYMLLEPTIGNVVKVENNGTSTNMDDSRALLKQIFSEKLPKEMTLSVLTASLADFFTELRSHYKYVTYIHLSI